MKLKCQCCGIEREFSDSQEAFKAGWDAPPAFSTHICCDLCPGVCIVLRASHTKAHEHWEKYGRPASFDRTCFTDETWNDPAGTEAGMEAIARLLGVSIRLNKGH